MRMWSDWTGEAPVPTLVALLFSGTIQMWEVFLFAARSTSTAAKSTHLPSGEGTGSPTRFSFIMFFNVKGCFAWENAGRVQRRTRRKVRRRMRASGKQESLAPRSEVAGQRLEVSLRR